MRNRIEDVGGTVSASMAAGDSLTSGKRFARRSATFIGSLTLAARIVERLGAFGQIAVIASLYGSSYLADRWFVASIVPLIIGAIAAETLSANLLPALVRSESKASGLVGAALWLAAALLLLVTGAYLAVAAVVVRHAAPAGSSSLALWCVFAPLAPVLGLSGLLTGALTYYERYVWPPFRSAIASVGGFVLMLCVAAFTHDIVWVAAAVTAGAALALAALLLELVSVAGPAAIARPGRAAMRAATALGPGLVAPVLGGLLGGQIFVLLERALASTLGVGAVATLSYARGVAFTPVIAAQSIALGVYPGMVRAHEEGATEHVRGSLVRGLRLTFFIAAVCGAFFAFFGRDVVDLLLQRGALSSEAAADAGAVLAVFSLALLGNMLMVFVARVFYAVGYFRAIVWSQAFALAAYAAVALPLRAVWETRGLALGFGIAETAAAVFAALVACRRIGLGAERLVAEAIVPAAARAALVAAGVAGAAAAAAAANPAPALRAGIGAATAAALAVAMLWTSRWPELGPLKRRLRRLAR